MVIREATINDISQLQLVRNSVKENTLSNPDLITNDDYIEYLTTRGKGWVCEIDNCIIGFSVGDLKENNVWALFVLPEHEKMGIGRKLHDVMLTWYFEQTRKNIWLSTSPGTRAELFYRKAGWKEIGILGNNEIKLEMSYDIWIINK